MCSHCFIIPPSVLQKLSANKSFSAEQREGLASAAKLGAELRKARALSSKITRVKRTLAPAGLLPVAAAPAVVIYDCKTSQTLPGAPVTKPNTSADATAKRVFEQTTRLAEFFATIFGRNSIDDSGMTMLSSIHYGDRYDNAFWNGTQMTYGDGDGTIFVDFSAGSDVIAHELTHGVTQHTLGLNYTNEAGGLNESISDCFGVMFKQWQNNEDFAAADWLIGKDIVGPDAIAQKYTCLRDMAAPDAKHCIAPQITRYAQYSKGMDPHDSSGVGNLAFYTICKALGGKSWDKAGQIWYRTLVSSGVKPSMSMKTFANRTRAVTAQLYAGDAAAAAAVDAGWRLVGL